MPQRPEWCLRKVAFPHCPPCSFSAPAKMSDESKVPGEAAAEPPRVVHLVSQEGDQYEVEIDVCRMSELVKTMLPEGEGQKGSEQGRGSVRAIVMVPDGLGLGRTVGEISCSWGRDRGTQNAGSGRR